MHSESRLQTLPTNSRSCSFENLPRSRSRSCSASERTLPFSFTLYSTARPGKAHLAARRAEHLCKPPCQDCTVTWWGCTSCTTDALYVFAGFFPSAVHFEEAQKVQAVTVTFHCHQRFLGPWVSGLKVYKYARLPGFYGRASAWLQFCEWLLTLQSCPTPRK